jgi:TPR repeat protein
MALHTLRMTHDMHSIRWQEEPDLEEYGRLYAGIMSGIESDIEHALIGFEALAARGSDASMFCLAWAYSTGGASRPKDLHKASYWYALAEQKGYATASYFLGVLRSELKDYREAFAAISRGAARGYLPAIYRLAWMFREGFGTAPDIDRCRTLLEKAASRGHLFAKRDLAGLLIGGRYGPRQAVRGVLMLLRGAIDVVAFCARAVRYGADAALYDERALA